MKQKAEHFHNYLMENEEVAQGLISRGLTGETLERYMIGYDVTNSRYTYPIFKLNGEIQNIRRYSPSSKAKMLPGDEGDASGRKNALYPLITFDQDKDRIIICEGENDALLLNQHGFHAITKTCGVASWNDEWNELFRDKEIVLLYDCDEAGRVAAEKHKEDFLTITDKIRVVDMGLMDGEDVTDWIVKYGRTGKELEELIQSTPIYDGYIEVNVVDGVDSIYCDKEIRFPALVVGKELSPYQIPSFVRCKCTSLHKRKSRHCKSCPLEPEEVAEGERIAGQLSNSGPYKNIYYKEGWLHQYLTFEDNLNELIKMMGGSDAQVIGGIKEAVGIPLTSVCRKAKVEILERQIVEEISVIPEISYESVDSKYAVRKLFHFGGSIDVNAQYVFYGTTRPDPNTQMGLFCTMKARATKNSISRFRLTDEIKEKLKVMRPDFDAYDDPYTAMVSKMKEIAKDLSHNVTHIYDRDRIIYTTLLVYHSVLNFKFCDNEIGRGWLEATVVGDTETGKTETIKNIVSHIKAGEFLTSGENTTLPGILGGLQKTHSGNWTVTWGKIPINDRGLCVIDEMENLVKNGIIGHLSGVRTSGVAELVKVNQQKTRAQTRLIFIANPLNGNLKDYAYGVETIRELYNNKEQDIRRISLALGVAKDEVSISSINHMRTNKVEHVYTSDILYASVMRAWNMRYDAVKWQEGVEQYVLDNAVKIGDRYVTDIPLLQGSGARKKIAALAVSFATMFYSTSNGEDVIVEKEHVDMAIVVLESFYDSSPLSFYSYSDQKRRENILKNEEVLKEYFDNKSIIDTILAQNCLYPADFEFMFNMDKDATRGHINTLVQSNAIRKSHQYFKKTQGFIQFLFRRREEIIQYEQTQEQTRKADLF